MDAYPYYQTTQSNGIDSGVSLFNDALDVTQAAANGKPVWVTETGWPVSGSTANLAVPSTNNAKTYWDEVGCPLFGKTNTWWFTIEDTDVIQPNPSFGIAPGNPLSTTPYFNLSCSNVASSSSSSTPFSTANSESSIASSKSSVASSGQSVATGSVLASSGGGLSPSEGAGNGIGSASGTGIAPTTATPTGLNGTTSATGTGGLKTTSKSTGSASGSTSTSSAPITASTNAANMLAGSVAGAIGALIAAAAAL
jgi:glucan endo-1,3-beta-D-glucosidase